MEFGDDKAKTEPMAELRQMAQISWQMYTALKDEGFSEQQAIQLVTEIVINGLSNN